jgi:hypothetical protein
MKIMKISWQYRMECENIEMAKISKEIMAMASI